MKFFYSFKEALNYSDTHSFMVSYRQVFFPVYMDFKGSDKWVVFTPGACSRNKPMPIFQRSSYSNQLDYNIISLFDPGLLVSNKLTNTWFVGTPSRYYGEYIATLIRVFLKDIGVDNNNVLFFGTSAGGLPALKIAQKMPGSNVWAGNIQTLADQHSAFPKMLPVLYPNKSHADCVKDYSDRFDARKMDGSYTLFYFQNKSDLFHYKNHYSPYREWWGEHGHRKVNANFYEYDDPETGHGSVGRAKEIALIKDIFSIGAPQPQWAKRM